MSSETLNIVLSNKVKLEKKEIDKKLYIFLKSNLYVPNNDYYLRKRLNKSVYKVPRGYNFLKEYEKYISMPRGFTGSLIRYCRDNGIDYSIIDKRPIKNRVKIEDKILLFDYQRESLQSMREKDFGVIVAPPGSGKTIIALKMIAERGLPSLIILHRIQLLKQWVDRIQSFLGLNLSEIGEFSGRKKRIGSFITVGMVQTLSKIKKNAIPEDNFGMIVVDECHHIPAKTFQKVMVKFNSFYTYGFTATPERKNRDEKIIFLYIGDIIHQMKGIKKDIEKNDLKVIIKKTNIYIPFNKKFDNINLLSKLIIFDSSRNMMIVKDVMEQIKVRKKILILTERIEHVEILDQYLKKNYEVITITGEDNEKSRNEKFKEIENGNFQLVISTGQFFGEGLDIKNLDCLFLVYPFSFHGKLIQYIGRIQRSEGIKMIFDYHDILIDYFDLLFKKRNKFYSNLKKEGC